MTLTTAYALDASTEGKVKILKVVPAAPPPRPLPLSHAPGTLHEACTPLSWQAGKRLGNLDNADAAAAILATEKKQPTQSGGK